MTIRLRALLEMRRQGPDGAEFPADAFVFGNEVGERLKSSTVRDLWIATCTAAGITAVGDDGLHFHDLRREFASQLLESGEGTHVIAAWLGHANLSTTSHYLSATRDGLQKAVKRFDQHRATQSRRTKRAEKRSAATRVRTSFAQTPANDPPADGFLSAKNSANLLN